MKRVITKYFTDFDYFINTSNSSLTWTIYLSLKITAANITYSTILLFLIHSFPCGPLCIGMLYLLKNTLQLHLPLPATEKHITEAN